MIKNLFWKNFKIKTEKNYDPQKEKLINLERPLSLKEIKKLKLGKLQIFIDDIISNKRINNLLFKTTAKQELAYFYRRQNAVLKNMNLLKSYNQNARNKKKSEIAEIILRKKNDSVFETIKSDIENYKINKKIEDKKYKIKFYKLNKKRENRVDEEAKLFYKPINNIRYSSYKRSLNKCFEKCKSDPNFNMPDVSLHPEIVFSRLYYNMIVSPNKNKHKKGRNKNNNNIKPIKKRSSFLKSFGSFNAIKKSISVPKEEILTDNYEMNSKIKKKFNLKNYFKEYRGKEFLIGKSFSVRNICFKKGSGGPNIRLEPQGKINLNKFKKNESLDKEDEYIIDVNDYRDENLNSNLHSAVKSNCEKLVKYFLDKNYSPNEQNINGDTPLHEAVKIKNKKIIQLLLDDGGNLKIKNKQGFSPYDMADREIQSTFKFKD